MIYVVDIGQPLLVLLSQARHQSIWIGHFVVKKNRAGIGYDGDSGRVYDGLNGGVEESNDTWTDGEIALTLDMRLGRLIMRKEYKTYTIYSRIDMDKQYRLAVGMFLTERYCHYKLQVVHD